MHFKQEAQILTLIKQDILVKSLIFDQHILKRDDQARFNLGRILNHETSVSLGYVLELIRL